MVKIILCKCKFRIELGTHNHLEKKKKRIKKARLGLRKLEALASAIKKNNNNARKVSLQQTE